MDDDDVEDSCRCEMDSKVGGRGSEGEAVVAMIVGAMTVADPDDAAFSFACTGESSSLTCSGIELIFFIVTVA